VPDLTGHELGRYHLLEKLGEGGMATVYKAYDTRLEREVAVKIIRREAFPPEVIEHMLKRFEREAKAMAKLSHSNIVKVHDYGEHEGSPYIVMELLSGGTLKQRLGKPVQWQKAVSLVEPIARALGYAHSEGILHRDVKPANILITKSGEPILTDFGIAKLLEQEDGHTLTGTGVGVGTPEYMAPEQGLGSKVDGRADIYSLGIVLYEIITGRKPFLADTPLAVLYKQMNDPLPRPAVLVPGLPESVEQMLLKALAKQPDARYKDMGEFASVLKNLEKNDGAQTSSVNPLLEIIQPEFEEHRKKSESYVTSDQISIKESQLKEPSENKNDGHNTRLKKEGKKIQAWKVAAGGIGLIGLLAVILLISGVFKNPVINEPFLTPTSVQSTMTPWVTKTGLEIGSIKVSLKDGMVMVYVPAGEYFMGSNDSYNRNEKPAHWVYLDAYWIDQTEVTNAMYQKCVDSGSCTAPYSIARYSNSQYADHPVVYVDSHQAKVYCQWAGKQLPTEAQWEKAARGTDRHTYPWGNVAPSCSLANYSDCIVDTTRVGSYEAGKSPYYVYDMAGNAWEWVEDWYGGYSSGAITNPQGPASGEYQVIRGGSWLLDMDYIRSSGRSWVGPTSATEEIGFRCAMDAE